MVAVRIAACMLFVVGLGCGSSGDVIVDPPPEMAPDGGTGATCPLSAGARVVLFEAALRTFSDVDWTLDQTSPAPPERAFARSLLGSGAAHASRVDLISDCDARRSFDQSCQACEPGESCLAPRCFQLGCEGSGIDTVRAWWAGAPLAYTTENLLMPASEVSYATAPAIELRFERAGTSDGIDTMIVQLAAHDDVQVTVDGEVLDASSDLQGTGAIRHRAGERLDPEVDLSVTFPSLATTGEPATLAIDSSDGRTVASVGVGGREVGRMAIDLGVEGVVPQFEWNAPCE